MKICILTMGTRGDVQPYVALGKGLKAAGHDVTLSTAHTFETFVTENGLRYAYMTDELIRLMDTAEGKGAMEGKRGKGFGLIKKSKLVLRQMLDEAWEAAQGADVIVYHPKTLAGYHIAEKLRIPVFLSLPLPAYTPTGAFANPLLGTTRLPGALNRLSYSITRMANAMYGDVVNDWRARMGLPPRGRFASEIVLPDGKPMPTLYCYSPRVIPTPGDWPATTVATGYWFLDSQAGWQPPAALADFLEAGEPPVYVGFGSIPSGDPEAKAWTVIEALGGQRAILASGWGGLKAAGLPGNVFMIEQAPHDWLFPRVKAVVHHGGAGTTAAGLRAGRPSVACPFFGDQPFWGQRVYELGAGPQPVPQKTLNAENLGAAIRAAVTDSGMQARAAALGEQIRAEDGVGRAVAIIERALA
jgi:sterol 3beta-glucosyltransferase